jgi:hypothetical protein
MVVTMLWKVEMYCEAERLNWFQFWNQPSTSWFCSHMMRMIAPLCPAATRDCPMLVASDDVSAPTPSMRVIDVEGGSE